MTPSYPYTLLRASAFVEDLYSLDGETGNLTSSHLESVVPPVSAFLPNWMGA